MGSIGFIIIGLATIIAVTLVIIRVLDIKEQADIRVDKKENA